MYTDPDGLFVDTLWDGLSLTTGVYSLVKNVKSGDVVGAVIDVAGIVADAAALALPFVPGGASTAIKAARATAAAADIVAGAMTVSDGIENGSGFEVASGALQVLGGVSSMKSDNLPSRNIAERNGMTFVKSFTKTVMGKTVEDEVLYIKDLNP